MSGSVNILDPSTDPTSTTPPKRPVQETQKPTPRPDTSILSGATNGLPIASQLARDRADIDAATPRMPVLSKPPSQQAQTDPFAAFGQPAMFIAALGSLFTRRPFVNAIQAMGGVLQSTQKLDADMAKHQYDVWKTETENALKMQKFQQDAYNAAIRKLDVDAKAGKAELETNILQFKDEVLQQAYAHGGVNEVKSLLFARQKQAAAVTSSQPQTQQYLSGKISIAEGLGSDDPTKQAAALDLLRKEMRADASGKGSTVTTRQQTDLNDIRLDAAKQDILSGDPVRVERGQRLAESILQLGPGSLKTPVSGSSSDQLNKVAAQIQSEHPEMSPGQVILEAKKRLHETSDASMLSGDALDRAARYYNQTRELPPGNRSRADNDAIQNRAAELARESGQDTSTDVSRQADIKASRTSLNFITKQSDAAKAYEASARKELDLAVSLLPKTAEPLDNQLLTRWARTGATQFGDVNVPKYQAALISGLDEYAKILSGATGAGGSTDASRAQAASLIPAGATSDQVRAIVDVLKQGMQFKVDGYEEQKNQIRARMNGTGATAPTGGQSQGASDPHALPDGTVVQQNGVSYRKQGDQWVPVQ